MTTRCPPLSANKSATLLSECKRPRSRVLIPRRMPNCRVLRSHRHLDVLVRPFVLANDRSHHLREVVGDVCP
jgi:hypothetical protein